MGHERRFKRKSRTSALPPIPDIIAASHRLASYQSDPDEAWRIAANMASCRSCCARLDLLRPRPLRR
jgi:hypothetical protein